MSGKVRILLPIAPGFEEIEALTVVDILRRAGASVTLAGTIDGIIEGRNGIKVMPDSALKDVVASHFDCIILPGGAKGTENLKKDQRVIKIVKDMHSDKRLIAAICAGPTILSVAGITKGRRVTAYPGARPELKHEVITDERVEVDGNIVTSQSPGTAMEFAFRLVEVMFGRERVREVNSSVLARL
jgi:4-methyl-5(b-hydroxyethyl)-thiazole monophosphate biosynthesis